MDITLCIDKLLPAAQYGGVPGTTKAEFDSLRWEDSRTKPTWQQIQDAWPLVQIDLENQETYKQLDDSDKTMFRKIDDLYEALIKSGTIKKSDLPNYFNDEIDARKTLRAKIK